MKLREISDVYNCKMLSGTVGARLEWILIVFSYKTFKTHKQRRKMNKAFYHLLETKLMEGVGRKMTISIMLESSGLDCRDTKRNCKGGDNIKGK